jgi:TP901 family phage tail tape measure protein
MATAGVTFAVGATMGASIASVFSTVGSRIKDLNADVRQLRASSTAASALAYRSVKLEEAKAAYAANPAMELKTALSKAQSSFDAAAKRAGKYGISVADAAKAQAELNVRLAKTETALARQQKLQANQNLRKELQGQMLGTVASFAAVAAPVKLAIDYESAMADVKKVTNFDAPGFKRFSDDMLTLSTRIPMTAEGLAKIAGAAGQAGIAESELLRFTEDAAKMAVAFDITAEEAGSAMTGLRTNFKLNQDGVISLGDAFNHMANNMDAKAGELVNFANRVGGTAGIYRFTGQQVGALGAAFVATKTPVEVAARATNSLMMKLGNAATLGKDAQAAFQRLGFSGKGMSEAFKKDAQGSMLMFLEAVKKSNDPMRELNAIMGEGFADEIAKLVGGLDEYKKALGLVADQSAYAGSMANEYEVRATTTANSLELLKNATSRLGIILGSTVLPGITAAANATVGFLEPVAQLAAAFPGVTTAIFGTVAGLAAGKLAFLGVRYAVSVVSDTVTAGKIVFAFMRDKVLANRAALILHRVASMRSAAAQGIHNAATAIANSRLVTGTAAMLRHGAASTLLAAKTGIVTVAQWALNAAMTANPIGLVVVAVGAVVAGLVAAYNHFEGFRNAVDTGCAAVAGFFTALWDGIVGGAKAAFDWIAAKFETVSGIWNTVAGWFGGGEETAAKPMRTAVPDAAGDAWGYTPPAAAPTTARTQAAPVAATAVPDAAVAAWGYTPPAATPTTAKAQTAPVSAMAASGAKPVQSAPIPAPRPTDRAAASGMGSPQINFSISFAGVPSQDVGSVLVSAIKAKERELASYFEKMLADIASNQRRLAYDQ